MSPKLVASWVNISLRPVHPEIRRRSYYGRDCSLVTAMCYKGNPPNMKLVVTREVKPNHQTDIHFPFHEWFGSLPSIPA